jgi:hypothetical protein
MAMIFRAADFQGFEFVIAGDAGNVGPEFRLDVLAQALLSLFVLKIRWIRLLE